MAGHSRRARGNQPTLRLLDAVGHLVVDEERRLDPESARPVRISNKASSDGRLNLIQPEGGSVVP